MNNRTKRLLFLLEDGGRKTVSGVPPLTYKAIEGTLKNYRIYGNTVDGESVGDRTANLFANGWKKGYIRADNGREEQIDGFICSGFFPVEYGQTYSISRNIRVGYDNIRGYRDDESFIGAGTDVCDVSNPFPSSATKIGAFTVTNENVAFIRFNDSANDLGMKYMIVEGTYTEQTMPDYEPYGYEVPVTINNVTTNFYLPEPLKMVGNDAEYVDFVEQKQYFADGTSVDVELPALPTLSGTNTLSVGTTVQPSKVEVMGKIKAVSAQPVLLSRQISDSLMFGSENELDVLLSGSENGADEPHQSAALTASPEGKPSFDVSEQLKGDDEYADDQSGYSSDENDLRDNSENTDDIGSDSEVGRESAGSAGTGQ